MNRDRLLELAGVPLTEGNIEDEHDDEIIENSEQAIKKMADIFEQTIEKTGIDQGSPDEWAEVTNDLLSGLHDELHDRGLIG